MIEHAHEDNYSISLEKKKKKNKHKIFTGDCSSIIFNIHRLIRLPERENDKLTCEAPASWLQAAPG